MCSRKVLGYTAWRGGLLYQILPVFIGTYDLLYSGHRSKHFEGTPDSQLLTTDGFQRTFHLLDHAQIERFGQLIDGLHVVMEFGEGGFDVVISHALASAPHAKYSHFGDD